MKLPFFGKNKEEEKVITEDSVFLALDIGTEFVKSAIFKVKNDVAEIIGYSRVPQHSKAMEGAMIINIDNVISSCDIGIGRALSIADKTLGQKCPLPEYVTMGIAGELVKGVCIIANYEREEPDVPITEEEIEHVVEGVKEQAFPGSIDDIAEEIGSKASQIQEINSNIDSTFIDGNKVDNPVGFTGEEVSYRVYSTFAPSIHVNSLFEIAKQLELEVLTIDVQPYAISKAFKGSHKSDFSSIFIDIGGGTTDIAVVQNGGIIGTKMIAFGGRVFSKRIANNMNIELHEAEKIKIDYSHKKLQHVTEQKIKKYVQEDTKLWGEGIEIALEEFEEISSFPTEFLLSGGGSELPEIYEAMIAHPWLTVLPFERFPKIKHVYPNQISNISDKTGILHSSADVAPAALVSISLEEIRGILMEDNK